VTIVRELLPGAAVALVMALVGAWLATESRIQAQAASIEGAWTLNKDLSDPPSDRRSGQGGDEGRYGRGGRGGRRGGGQFGGGMRGGGGGARGGDPEEAARMRDALHDIMTAPDHLTVTQADQTIVITSGEGRTTRLSADGKKVKDENTRIERKTKWDGDTLISEVSGLGPGKITETYTIDPEKHQLRVTVQAEGRGNRPATTQHRVYDADQR
jgi:hypothetical protein